MRVHLGSDHAGLDLKTALSDALRGAGHEPVDHGPEQFDALDDYPPFVLRAAEAAAAEPDSLAVVIGGSGNGEAIAANKVTGVRCALVWCEETARLAREHNDANVAAVGGRMHDAETAVRLVQLFLDTPFSAEERHVRRIRMLSSYETSGELPPLP